MGLAAVFHFPTSLPYRGNFFQATEDSRAKLLKLLLCPGPRRLPCLCHSSSYGNFLTEAMEKREIFFLLLQGKKAAVSFASLLLLFPTPRSLQPPWLRAAFPGTLAKFWPGDRPSVACNRGKTTIGALLKLGPTCGPFGSSHAVPPKTEKVSTPPNQAILAKAENWCPRECPAHGTPHHM